MKAFIALNLVCNFLLFYKLVTVSANNVRFMRSHDTVDDIQFFPNEQLLHHEVHNIISSFHANNQHLIHPKYGSGMMEPFSKATKYVYVDVVFATPLTQGQALILLGPIDDDLKVLGCFHTSCSIYISIDKVDEVASFDEVHLVDHMDFVSHVDETMMQRRNLVGSVTSDGDVAVFADLARDKYSVNGQGIRVGIIGDTFNCYGGNANDTLTGDLPSNITELSFFNVTECDELEQVLPLDQSRAVMQVIYDIAPGTQFAFKSGHGGTSVMAAGIKELAQIGCDLIVTTISYLDDPFFQDGIIAQAVDEVASQGVTFFTGAGETARSAWDAPLGFVPVSVNETLFGINATNSTTVYHQFGEDSSGKPIISQRIAVQNILTPVAFIMQWDEPSFSVSGAPGCQVDLDLYFLRNNTVVGKSLASNIGKNPVEFILFEPWLFGNVTGEYIMVDMVIVKKQGDSPKQIKVIPFAPVVDVKFEFATNTPTLVGLKNAKSAAVVGAAPFFQTPAFGVSPPLLQFFSSAGGVPILFDKFGNRADEPEIRNKPNFVGPDSVLTTFYTNGPMGLYYGTPCAAGHVAGVAALMLQLNGGPKSLKPQDIRGILERTAIDMNDNSTVDFDSGFDFSTGYGFVNASAALDVTASFTTAPTKAPATAPTRPDDESPTSSSHKVHFFWISSLALVSFWFP